MFEFKFIHCIKHSKTVHAQCMLSILKILPSNIPYTCMHAVCHLFIQPVTVISCKAYTHRSGSRYVCPFKIETWEDDKGRRYLKASASTRKPQKMYTGAMSPEYFYAIFRWFFP